MQGQKKYCLNVSSYKYKRECMKLFSTTLKAFNTYNNNDRIESENLCPGGKRCKNYGIILNLEQKIKELNDTVNQLTKINEYSESNHTKDLTPKKKLEAKRHDSFNEFCNSFRNSLKKKKKTNENNRNLTGSISLPPQVSEPYRIKAYNSISNDSKIPFKKISNKRHINLDLNNIRNYKTNFCFNTENKDINEQYFLKKKENDMQKDSEDKIDKNSIEEDNNSIQKLYFSITNVYNNKEEFKNNNNSNEKINNNFNKENGEKKNLNQKQKSENEIKNKNEYNENISKKNNKEENEKNQNSDNKESKKNINSINFPIIKKVKTYKLIAPIKASKNKRYDFELFDNKINCKKENKLYFRKFKGKIRNSFNSSNNKIISNSFGFRNNTEGSQTDRWFNFRNKNSKTLSNQDRYNKIKLYSFTNFRPLSLTQKPFKIKLNISQNEIFSNKKKYDLEKVKIENNSSANNNNFNSSSNSFEFNRYIKDLENLNNFNNETKNDKIETFNEILNLASSKREEIMPKIKSLSIEQIDKYCSFIKNSLSYLKESIEVIYKIKIFSNLISNSKNKKNKNENQKELLNDEFIYYKEELIKLLDCENIYIFIYDPIKDCLISKGEKEELKYEKDKDLIGLSFISGKKIRYETDNNSSSHPLLPIISKNLLNKINNLLIYPLKDKNDNINGIIEAVNKNKCKENNIYFKDKSSFNKNDEMIMSLISKYLGNFCRYYNNIIFNRTYLSYYHILLLFSQKLLLNKEKNKEIDLLFIIKEVTELSKIIFDMDNIKFLLCNKDNFYDIQNNKNISFEGLVYKSYKEKKMIFTSKPLTNSFYSNKSDLIINILSNNKNEELITMPILDLRNSDVLMIIQIKTNKKLEINDNKNAFSLDDDKLSDENLFIIENILFILQKYFSENIELIQKYK